MSNNANNNTTGNYFELLGLPVSFDIDKECLNHNYHEIQRSVHPDKYANASDQQRRLSVQKAAQINDALVTLKNPLQRSIYLLSLNGVELTENDTNIDPAFLMEQMEWRENLSQVGDSDDPLMELDNILDTVKDRIAQTIDSLSLIFQEIVSMPKPKEVLLREAKDHVLKMQFLNRLQEECLNKEEDLNDQL